MTDWLIQMFGISLIVTIIIEGAIAFFFGLRSKKSLLLVLLVNILTNPPAVLFHWLGRLYLQTVPGLWLQVTIEIAVIITEAVIYHSFARSPHWRIRHPVLLSIFANMCSWIAGILLSNSL